MNQAMWTFYNISLQCTLNMGQVDHYLLFTICRFFSHPTFFMRRIAVCRTVTHRLIWDNVPIFSHIHVHDQTHTFLLLFSSLSLSPSPPDHYFSWYPCAIFRFCNIFTSSIPFCRLMSFCDCVFACAPH